MGRTKSYDREELVGRAMQLFWLRGYQGTSTADLVSHLGVNKFSLYAEFGSKQALYDLALERYDREIVTRHFSKLEDSSAGLAEIQQVLDFFARSGRTAGSELGCFMCNSATEVAPHEPGNQRTVEAFVGRVRAACETAFVHARERGELVDGAVIAEEASFVATTLMGLFVLMRARIEPSVLLETGRAAQRHVSSLCKH